MELASGTLVGPYRILSLLGRGGMGEVYSARDDRLGRDVALKVLPGTYASDPDRLRRFDSEARAAAALNHPNILAVHDIGTHAGAPYIVSEHLRGQTLGDLLGHGALVLRKAVEYGIAVATGLAAAHDHGIVHRDIKPENVFVTEDGRVKILDFGLAKLREPAAADADSTRLGAADTQNVIVGTAGYMSPEQVRGQPVDHRSDLFSLGAVLYEMVCGERAFDGGSAIETMSAILKHDPPDLSAGGAAISPQLASVIRRCLEKERDQRFQSARDLAFALGRLTGFPTTGSPPSLDGRPTSWRRWAVGSAAAAALVATIGASAYWRPAPAASSPVFQQLSYRRGQIGRSRFAPDGQTVITSGAWEGQAWEVLSTRLDTGESTQLPIGDALLRSISKTGEMAVVVKESILARVPIGGSGPRELAENVFDADWARDGSLAVVFKGPNRAWVEYPLGTRIYEPKVPGTAVYDIRLSPDATRIALGEQEGFGGGREWLTIIDRGGGIVSQSGKRGSTVDAPFAWTADGREIWFTASEADGRSAIHAMSIDGHERVVHRTMGSVRIMDVAPDGRALLANESSRADMSFVDMNTPRERDLTWKDWSRPLALSDDGRMLAFGFGGRTSADGRTLGFIRPTDGAPAIMLSEDGNPGAFSPDGKWVATGRAGDSQITLVPTGVGESRRLDAGRVTGFQSFMRWLPNGTRIVFVGRETGRPNRVFIQSVAAGPPEPLTPEGAFGPLVVSADSASVIVNNEKRQLTRYPITGGAPLSVAGALPRDEPLAWSPDGNAFWVLVRSPAPPAKIFRIDLRNGNRSLWREVPYTDPAATDFAQLRVVMSADGSRFVYGYHKRLSELFVASGLR